MEGKSVTDHENDDTKPNVEQLHAAMERLRFARSGQHTMNFVDHTGEPPSDADVADAINATRAGITKFLLQIPPELGACLPNVLRCLQELQRVRRGGGGAAR
jgi:hypothetical protein